MAIPLGAAAHANVNCSRLERSRPFYELGLGLSPAVHTNPEPQSGAGFGLERAVQWDAWLLHGAQGPGAGPGIDLLEWKLPLPIAPGERQRLGSRAILLGVDDLDNARERLLRQGGGPAGPIHAAQRAGRQERVFHALDPDGTALQVRQAAGFAFEGVAIVCSDAERSLRFYTDVLGLEVTRHGKSDRDGPAPAAEAWRLTLPGRPDGFGLEIEAGRGDPPLAEPHQLGIYRIAFLAPDLLGCFETLRERGVRCLSPPVDLDLGPACPVPGCRALLFLDPDGTCLELIELP